MKLKAKSTIASWKSRTNNVIVSAEFQLKCTTVPIISLTINTAPKSLLQLPGRGGGGWTSLNGYIGMSNPKGYGLVLNRVQGKITDFGVK